LATNPSPLAQALGYLPGLGPSGSTFNANAANNWLGLGLLAPPGGKTLNTVRMTVSTITGSLAATDLTCDVYSDLPGAPNASLASTNNIGGSPPVVGWNTWQGLSQVLTAFTQYWLVFKNVNGVPGTNFPQWRYVSNATASPFMERNSTNKNCGFTSVTSTNGGTSWSAISSGVGGFRLGFSDGSFFGMPMTNSTTGADHAFGANEVGVKFTSPANCVLAVAGIGFQCEALGAPSGQLRFRIYNGTTLLGTTANLALTVPTALTGNWLYSYFASDVVVQPSTVLRVTMSDSAADNTSNCYLTANDCTVDSDANSLPLLPFGGTLMKTTFNGTTWTDTNTSILPFALLLDDAGGFVGQRRPRLYGIGA
jgi:hypothetical protein